MVSKKIFAAPCRGALFIQDESKLRLEVTAVLEVKGGDLRVLSCPRYEFNPNRKLPHRCITQESGKPQNPDEIYGLPCCYAYERRIKPN